VGFDVVPRQDAVEPAERVVEGNEQLVAVACPLRNATEPVVSAQVTERKGLEVYFRYEPSLTTVSSSFSGGARGRAVEQKSALY